MPESSFFVSPQQAGRADLYRGMCFRNCGKPRIEKRVVRRQRQADLLRGAAARGPDNGAAMPAKATTHVSPVFGFLALVSSCQAQFLV